MARKSLFTVLALCAVLSSKAQNYTFSGSMSREVLENYLERAITMQGQSDVEGTQMLSEAERQRNIMMLDDLDAKFVSRLGGWWENGWGQTTHDAYFAQCSLNVANIKARDPQVICQAGVFEYVSTTVNTFHIPAYVFTAFGLPIVNRTFNYSAMLYPPPASQYIMYGGSSMDEDGRLTTPDITQPETRLWFYYMATRFISVGFEAIHFGQAEIMNRRDIGNVQWYDLLRRIRQYAATRNRGVVLFDAHLSSGGMYYEPGLGITREQWYRYRSGNKPTAELLLDFCSMGVDFKEGSPCMPGYQPALVRIDTANGMHGRTFGGIHPQGWSCVRAPYLVEFDNGEIQARVGCDYDMASDWRLWGWDEISWFASQPVTRRNDILRYTYYKIKCLDKNGHLAIPGMRGVSPGNNGAGYLYRANTGIHNQQTTIRDLWNGVFAGAGNWVHHNFTQEEVYNPPAVPDVQGSLVFAGTDRMYYIAADGYIRGYVKDNVQSGWYAVSPSYAAGNVGAQVKAKSDLVASPDGSLLLYIGVDDYIHGFSVYNAWTYTYVDFMKSPMLSQGLRAQGSLLFASNLRVYYIARENSGATRVHGFIRYAGNWLTVSPTYAGQVQYTAMVQAAGALTYGPAQNRLYYVGVDGFLYYYSINTDWAYTYVAVPHTALVSQNVRVMPTGLALTGNRVFYVGKEIANGNALRIHALIDNGNGTWGTVSPSWAAHYSNGQNIVGQVQPGGNGIAVSPNGQTVAYVGADGKVYYYRDINAGWNYAYGKAVGYGGNYSANSLQFTDNATLFLAPGPVLPDRRVHCFRFQESYCENPAVRAIEPSFVPQ